MKLLIATGIFPPDIGGPATMLSHLAQGLTERGFEVKILTYTENTKAQKTQKHENTNNVYRVKKNNKLKYFWQMMRLAKWADLIYTTDTYSVGYFVYLIKKITGKKYILRFTGDSAWETARTNDWTKDYIMNFQDKKYDVKIEKLKVRRNKIFFNADKIIVDCEFNKKLSVSAVYPEEEPRTMMRGKYRDDERSLGFREYKNKISVIYNAVDFNVGIVGTGLDLSMAIKQKYSPHGEKIMMTACRLTPWKGVDQIINILPDLIKQIGSVNFLILGEGSELENLKSKIKNLKLDDNVHFLGKINQEDMANYFKIADVFILNSQYEGLSHTLLEVMQAGAPIIASNCGGNPELIENGVNGFLFEYNNKQEMLASLEKILIENRRDRSRPVPTLAEFLSQNARKKVKEFKWSEVVEKTTGVIKSLL